jgi:hypothetical protein
MSIPRLTLPIVFAIFSAAPSGWQDAPLHVGQRPGPVFYAGANVPRHRTSRTLAVAGQERFDDRQMLLNFACQAAKVVP